MRLLSRKLIGSLIAILAITGVVLGLAVIVPSVVTTELAGMSLTLIAGLGGYQIARQARVDDHPIYPSYKVGESGEIERMS